MDPVLQELFKYGPVAALLGIAVWALWNKSETGGKAYIDFLSNKSTDMTNALRESASAQQSVTKALESLEEESRLTRQAVQTLIEISRIQK